MALHDTLCFSFIHKFVQYIKNTLNSHIEAIRERQAKKKNLTVTKKQQFFNYFLKWAQLQDA